MRLYPEDIETRLEFDRIKERLATHCFGDLARARCMQLRQFTQKDRVEKLLEEVQQAKLAIEQGDKVPMFPYEDIREDLYLLDKENYVLEMDSIIRIMDQVIAIEQIHEHFQNKRIASEYPVLFEISAQIDHTPEILSEFSRIFDEEKKIRPNASPTLSSIFKKIRNKERQIQKEFDLLAIEYKKKGYLSENVESYRSGRRVLSVSAENKRSISGIIHDESATGKTVFIEPNEVVAVQNELYELESEKRQEIYKILKEFCNRLQKHIPSFDLWQKIIVRMDFILAKAKLAIELVCSKPKVVSTSMLVLKDAFHPYLLLVNKDQDKKTIPFNLELNNEQRILVISGPNAGGKSVTMKAVGLIQLMIQSGMLVPLSPDSIVGMYTSLMVDIGDQQSIEDDLSTYSSRLENMKFFIDYANERSLVLLDEFGSGTDPKMGGALAEAILHHLRKKRCQGVATTHYSNIKMYAHQNDGLFNGAMLFNKDSLTPIYQLETGKPGSSFAYEIAERIGLQKHVLNYAKKKGGKSENAIDQLLIDLQHEKQTLSEQLVKAQNEKGQLQKLIQRYEELNSDLNFRKRKFRMESKENQFKSIDDNERELKELIKSLRKEKDLEKAEALAQELKEKKEKVNADIQALEEQVFYNQNYETADFNVGDFVKLKKGGSSAEIIDIHKDNIEIAVGILRMKVKALDIVPADEPIERKSKRSITMDLEKNVQNIESKLDIRGYRKSEAELFITEFLDNAYLSNAATLTVIHGVGSGILRKTLLHKLKEYKGIKRIYQDTERWGDGVTFIEM